MLKYRHRKFGHIVDVPEPADVRAAHEAEATRLALIGTKRAKREAESIGEYGEWQASRQRQTLARMDESAKWERYTEPPAAVAPAPEPAEPAEPKAPVKKAAPVAKDE